MKVAFKNHLKGGCLPDSIFCIHLSSLFLLNSFFFKPNYPWFDRNSQPKPDRPRGKKWVGKNDGSHTSSKTIVACFTTADLTPALITGPVELGGAWEKGQSSAPLPHQLLVEPEVKHFPSKNLLILHSPPPILTFRRYCFIPHHVHYLLWYCQGL